MPGTPSWLKFKKWRARAGRRDGQEPNQQQQQQQQQIEEEERRRWRQEPNQNQNQRGQLARRKSSSCNQLSLEQLERLGERPAWPSTSNFQNTATTTTAAPAQAAGDQNSVVCDYQTPPPPAPTCADEQQSSRPARPKSRLGLLMPRALTQFIERATSPNVKQQQQQQQQVDQRQQQQAHSLSAAARPKSPLARKFHKHFGAARPKSTECDGGGDGEMQDSRPLANKLRHSTGATSASQPSERIAPSQATPPPPSEHRLGHERADDQISAPATRGAANKSGAGAARPPPLPAVRTKLGQQQPQPQRECDPQQQVSESNQRPVGIPCQPAAAAPCQLTARTRDNQCAVHANSSTSGNELLPPPPGKTMAPRQGPVSATATTTTTGPKTRAKTKPKTTTRTRTRTPKDKAKSVATWPLAKQTLDNNLPNEFRLGHFGDCEDLLSSHLAGRLFGAITCEQPLAVGSGGEQLIIHSPRAKSQQQQQQQQQQHFDQLLFRATSNEMRLADQLRLFNYNHKRPFARAYECPPTGWLYNATGLQPINSGSSAQLKAKLFASGGFRRRSYDDQEGDNDINIILQPSDIDDIEQQAKASYARFKATACNNNNDYHDDSTPDAALVEDDDQERTINKRRQSNNETITLDRLNSQAKTRRSMYGRNQIAPAAEQIGSTKLKALTNIFEDIRLAKCLLDQDYNQTVRLFIRKSALNWNFNSFTFDALCCGRSLTELLLHLFDYYNLYNIFNLDIIKVLKCFRLLEYGYHSTNPYHNSVHAADVTQAMHCFIQENKIRKHVTNLEILCSILAAVCHDLDHPGVNQSFLVATKNPLADLYQNNSVLENHHWRFALCIFKESKLFDHFDVDVLEDMKQQLKQLILATDIARQNDYLKRFKAMTSSQQFSMSNNNDRALVLQMALKCADLGNPCRPWLISRVWSNLICDEFYRMGQIERRLGVPLTPICQREKTSIAGIQTDFFRFIVLPLLELWHNFLESPLSNLLVSNFDHNYARWQRASRIVQQLRRRKSVACLEPVQDLEGSAEDQDGFDDQQQNLNERARQNRSASLFYDPVVEDIYSRHSFRAIKRASSDYIKSGNGKLESLRDFQLNRIIEKSPAMSRARKFRREARNQTNAPARGPHPSGENSESSSAIKSDPRESHQSFSPSSSSAAANKKPPSTITRSAQFTSTKTSAATTTTQQSNPSRDLSGLYTGCFRHQALSPIQDQDGTSPEVQVVPATQPSRRGSSENRRGGGGGGGGGTATAGCNQFEGDDPRESEDSGSSGSSPRSQASSTSSSPVMKRSISSRTSIDQRQHLQQQQQHHQQHRSSINFPFQEQNRMRGTNASGTTRQSTTHSKAIYSNRRRESDPGFLTENYELAATIVFLQYQNNPLFHKRRSSLPIFVPNRRSSK